jgi:carbamoyl-phosphate synthase large subunit
MAAKAFTTLSQILFNRDFRGWKEPKYKVFRDSSNDFSTIWDMENFDPLGIHTGDSIVLAPSQSCTNHQSFILGQMALKVVLHLGIVGECNILCALHHPGSEQYFIIN